MIKKLETLFRLGPEDIGIIGAFGFGGCGTGDDAFIIQWEQYIGAALPFPIANAL